MAQNEYIPKSQVLGVDSQKGAEYDAEKEKSTAAGIAAATNDQLKSQYGVTDQQLSDYGTVGEPSKAAVRNDPTYGGAGADAALMSEGEYAIVQQLKAEYDRAKAAGDQAGMDKAHAEAEAIRARHKYSGGTDGSMHITGLEHFYPADDDYKPGAVFSEGGGVRPQAGAGTGGASGDLKNLLDQWQNAALAQQNGKIDYAVAKAVAELERALEDAQPQFKEQAEFVDKEARQAMDNSALYAEARGDKGGIGQSQYNEIQAAAAQNHLAVQQAQTKLSTDTARQIADLRAQGEFEKADAALEIAQSYLSQLVNLEQWAAEYNLSVAQFEASLQQWQAEFDLAMQQFAVDTDLAYGQLTGTIPSTGQLTLDGQSQLMAQQLRRAAGGGDDSYEPTLTWPQTLAQVEAGNLTPAVLKAYEYYMGEAYDTGSEKPPVPTVDANDIAGKIDRQTADIDMRSGGATVLQKYKDRLDGEATYYGKLKLLKKMTLEYGFDDAVGNILWDYIKERK